MACSTIHNATNIVSFNFNIHILHSIDRIYKTAASTCYFTMGKSWIQIYNFVRSIWNPHLSFICIGLLIWGQCIRNNFRWLYSILLPSICFCHIHVWPSIHWFYNARFRSKSIQRNKIR